MCREHVQVLALVLCKGVGWWCQLAVSFETPCCRCACVRCARMCFRYAWCGCSCVVAVGWPVAGILVVGAARVAFC